MILCGWVTDTSIAACFLDTLGPGLLIMCNFAAVNLWMSRKFNLVLDEKPALSRLAGEVTRRGIYAFPALLMPVIILGGIYGGILTPTGVGTPVAFPFSDGVSGPEPHDFPGIGVCDVDMLVCTVAELAALAGLGGALGAAQA